MNPYHYIQLSRQPEYRAFAREKGTRLKGVVVVRKDSPIQFVDQLADQYIAFPAQSSFAPSIAHRRKSATNCAFWGTPTVTLPIRLPPIPV